jgi:hypothetical protein
MPERCSKCVLPDTYPGIYFDDQGVCNYCHTYEPIRYKGDDVLRTLLEKYRGVGKWDCLVPVSGGRDSTFVLYQLMRKYDMKVLAYNYDNGFVEKQARVNLETAARALNVKIIYRRSVRDIQCKNLRYITKMNLHKSPGHVWAFLCSGCRNGIWGGAYQAAEEYRIPLIVFGESAMESGGFKKMISPRFTPNAREKIRFAAKMPCNFLMRKYVSFLLEREFPLNEENQEIQKVNFFSFEKWDGNRITFTIRDKLGWAPKTGQGSWRFDCQIHALVNRMTHQLFGLTEKDELYSKMIREGQLERRDALKRLKAEDDEEAELEVIEKVLSRLRLHKLEKDKILKFCQAAPRLENSR